MKKSLRLSKKKKNAATLPNEGWALFKSLENSPVGKI